MIQYIDIKLIFFKSTDRFLYVCAKRSFRVAEYEC